MVQTICRTQILAALVGFAALITSASALPPAFPLDHPWNQKITNAPVAANSAAIMSHIVTTYGNNRIHPDFGQDYQTVNTDLYGIPFNIVHGNSTPMVQVVIGAYASQSDIVPAPIPANAVLEGDFQTGPRPGGLAVRGDSHLIVWDIDNNILYEYFAVTRPSENSDNKWHAYQQSVWNLNTNNFRPLQWTSADAAGLSILAGLARPDEGLPISQGGAGIITHAIRFTLQNAVILNKFIYPGSHVANPGNNNPAIQPPMGSRFRLKASVNVSALNPQSKIIAQAMKDYGLILADNGSNFFFTGTSYTPNATNGVGLTWDDDDIQSTTNGLKSLRYNDFEVVDLTPRITSISPSTAAAGATITITGLNFSGAAGNLAVHFGTTPATGVTFIDDAHLTAIVPSGTGTTDVRVISGTAVVDSQNINPQYFGNGISAIVPADQFTYSTGPTGICCRGATCALIAQSACIITSGAAGASWSAGTSCNALAIATTPCCYADYNKSNTVSLQDIFDFINDWLAGRPTARFAGDGTPGTMVVQNIFDFINAWFAGC